MNAISVQIRANLLRAPRSLKARMAGGEMRLRERETARCAMACGTGPLHTGMRGSYWPLTYSAMVSASSLYQSADCLM